MKTYTFKTSDTKNNTFFLNNNKPTNYSQILDDLILSSVVKNNSYLFNVTTPKSNLIDSLIKKSNIGTIDADYISATKFLANYKKTPKKLPFILGKVYKLNNGSAICFYDDEIQIDADIYSYSDFANFDFINTLSPKTKKTIIDIYVNGININISL